MLQPGQEAPDFTLPSTRREDFTLSEIEGMPVVLYFYPKDDSVGCRWEARAFRAQFEILSKHQVTILGISRDNLDDHCEFQGKERLPFELLSDAEEVVHDAYDVWKKGLLGRRPRRCTYIISPNRTIAHVYPSVLPIGHARTVVTDVNRLGREQGWFQNR